MKTKNLRLIFVLIFTSTFISCKKNVVEPFSELKKSNVKYAQGFDIKHFTNFTKLILYSSITPKKEFYIIEKNQTIPDSLRLKNIIRVPIQKLVATSTSHIPMIEAFAAEATLVGFPNKQYISSEKTYHLVQKGQITELGNENEMNMEMLLALNPDVLMTTAQQKSSKWENNLKTSHINLVENSDWLEKHPLGRSEWIKVFGLLFNQTAKADSIFNSISDNYNHLKNSVLSKKTKPKVMCGSLFQDIWYMPAGESFLAQMMADAQANYLWSETKGTGSLSLSPEMVLSKAKNADFWIAPGDFTTYSQFGNQHKIYQSFDAFTKKNVFTYAHRKGKNGGLLFFETSPLHPDWVLEDLISIFHPELKKNNGFHYFSNLE